MESLPPPIPPRRARPIQAAIPLEYGNPDLVLARPSRLVLLGTVGLLLGALSILTNSFGLTRLPTMRAQTNRILAPVVPVPPVAPTVAPYAGDLFAATGWPRERRQAFVDSIHDPSLSADRQVMLKRLLGQFGTVIDPSNSASADMQVDHLPAGPDGLHELGTTVIHLPSGVVWINDSAAYFQTSSGPRYQIQLDRATDASGVVTKSSVAVAEELDSIHSVVGPGFNSIQAAVVAADELAAPPRYDGTTVQTHMQILPTGGRYFDPLENPKMNGNTLSYGNMPTLYILPNGSKTNSMDNYDPTTGIYTPPAPTGFTPYTPTILNLIEIDAVASLVLGLILLVVALLLLIGTNNAAAWAVRFAWVKIAQVSAWLTLTAWIVLPRIANNPNAPPGYAYGLYFGGVGVILLQGVYPVALLRMLRSETMRAYFYQGGVDAMPESVQHSLGPALRQWMTAPIGRILCTLGAVLAVACMAEHIRQVFYHSVTGSVELFQSTEWHSITALLSGGAALICIGSWSVPGVVRARP